MPSQSTPKQERSSTKAGPQLQARKTATEARIGGEATITEVISQNFSAALLGTSPKQSDRLGLDDKKRINDSRLNARSAQNAMGAQNRAQEQTAALVAELR